jgi:hypothetical protein
VALPNNSGTTTNEEFWSQIYQVDIDVLRHLREKVNGGFNEEKYSPYIGFTCLRKHLESKLQKRYKEAVPATLALLEERCIGVSAGLSRLESKLQATTDVAQPRRSARFHAASICTHLVCIYTQFHLCSNTFSNWCTRTNQTLFLVQKHHLLDGAADLDPELWGLTTEEEQKHGGTVRWPGISLSMPHNGIHAILFQKQHRHTLNISITSSFISCSVGPPWLLWKTR